MAKIQKVNRICFIALGFILVSFNTGAQDFGTKYFSFGAIPFNRTVDWVESTFPADTIEYNRNPEASFLAFDAVTRDEEHTQIRELFKGAIKSTSGWGSTYVMFYDRLVRRIDLNFPNEPNVNLFFVSQNMEEADQRLFLVHKAMKTQGRFTEVFEQIKERVTGLLGVDPVVTDTRHRGQQFDTYARVGMWRQPKQIVLVLVRETNLQSKVSFVHYIYIDAGLWREYKRLVRQIEGSGQESSDGRAPDAHNAF